MLAEKPETARLVRVGLISDTHGRLDPRVPPVFERAGVSAIVHAGDVGKAEVLYELQAVAPVTAVLGNCDHDLPGWPLDIVAQVTVAGVRILAIHDIHDLGPVPEGVGVVVCGHSHRPSVHWLGPTLVVNPGSASQPRSMPGRSVGVLDIAFDASVVARIVMLDDAVPPGD